MFQLLPGCNVACMRRYTVDIRKYSYAVLTIVPRDVGRYCRGQGRLRWVTTGYTARVGLVQQKHISAILLYSYTLATRDTQGCRGNTGTCSYCSCTTRTSSHTRTASNKLVIACLLGQYRNYCTRPSSCAFGPGAIIPVLPS